MTSYCPTCGQKRPSQWWIVKDEGESLAYWGPWQTRSAAIEHSYAQDEDAVVIELPTPVERK